MNSRSIFIGDVHGCLAELDALMALLGPAPADRLYFLGDLVDRGPDSIGVVRRVRELLGRHPGSVAIIGNHEMKSLRARERGEARAGWAADASDEDWAFLDAMPLFHRASDLGVLMVHGGLFPAFFRHHGALGDVPEHWRRGGGKRGERMRRFPFVRHIDPDGNMAAGEDGRHWSEAYDGAEGVVYFGHDPQLAPAEPLRAAHAIGLDTGACFGGRLTAAVLGPGHDPRVPDIVSVPGGPYASPRLRYED